jgi:hypothetical protein
MATDDENKWWNPGGLFSADGPGGIFADINAWTNPQSVPAGAMYDPETLKMARAALLSNIGTNLLAASQPGLTGAQRAAAISQVGAAPAAYNDVIKNGSAVQLQRAQIEKLRRDGARDAAWMALLRGGNPAAAGTSGTPAVVAPNNAVASAPGASPFAATVVSTENAGGSPDARNPLSSAMGDGQFLRDTWIPLVRQERPDLAAGKTDDEILALRSDGALSRQMIDAYARQNARALGSAGVPVTPAHVALAHRFGPSGALSLIRASDDAPMPSIMPESVIAANPDLRDKTVGQVRAAFNQRFANLPVPGSQPAAGAAPAASPSPNVLANLTEEQRLILGAMGFEKGAPALLQESLTRESFRIARPDEARDQLRHAYDPNSAYKINTRTGDITRLEGPPRQAVTLSPDEARAELREAYDPRKAYQRRPDGVIVPIEGPARQAVTLSPDEARAELREAYDPRKAYQRRPDGIVVEVGNPSTNVNVNTGNALTDSAIRRIDEARKINEPQVNNLLPRLHMMMAQLEGGLPTSSLDDLTLRARTLARDLGLLSQEQADKANQQELFRSLSMYIIPKMREAGSGASSDRDVAIFAQAVPTLARDPEGNRVIAAAMINTINRDQRRVSLMEQYMSEAGPNGQPRGNLVGFDDWVKDKMGPMIPRISDPAQLASMPPGSLVMLDEQSRNVVLPNGRRLAPSWPFYVVPSFGGNQ